VAGEQRLFFDASALVAASASPDGGSSLVIEVCMSGRAQAIVTQLVLREAERNIKSKLSDQALIRFYNLLGSLNPELIPLPSPSALQQAAQLVQTKDAHVLAGARDGHATHLITLDRKHLLSNAIRQGALPIILCTPGDFLEDFLKEQN
jgi:predicted nucleic acid-binding protein